MRHQSILQSPFDFTVFKLNSQNSFINPRSVLLITILLFGNLNLKAQEKGETVLDFGYGRYSTNLMWYDEDILSVRSDESNYSEIFYLSFKSSKSKRVALGATISYEQIKDERISYGSIFNPYSSPGKRNRLYKFWTFAFEMAFPYITQPKFQMYSGFGLGITFWSDKIDDFDNSKLVYPNFQLNFFGFRFGKEVALKLEFGFGYKGIVNGGLSIPLSSKDKSTVSK